MAIFKGAGVAIVTPFHEDGSINYEKFAQLIEDQIAGGTDAIIVCGTTGEASTLTHEEHLDLIRFCAEKVNGRVPVVAGTGSNCTKTAVYLSTEAEKYGVDGLLLVTPYYNKATQNGLYEHFKTVADSVKLPIILYNVPGRTGCNIMPETVVRLCTDVSNIVAIKEASGNIGQVVKLMALANGKVDLYSGNDDQVVPLMSLGGKGVISVLSNVAPRQMHDICQKFFDGDVEGNMKDRSQVRQKRAPKEIGISAVRGGTIVGDHDVIFAGADEVITFSHRAYSKAVFGKGAIQAAKFLAGKPAGMYDMSDVIDG